MQQRSLSILHISDTHNRHRAMGTLPAADVLVHSGDITMNGTEQEVLDFLEWFCALPHRHKLFIAGNHDSYLYGATIEGLPAGCHYLCYSSVAIEGICFHGMPMFSEDRANGCYETQIAGIPLKTDVLISHQPPLGFLDCSNRISYGSLSLLERVDSINPRLHLFGHIHAAYGEMLHKDTLFVNSSVMNDAYVLANKPHTISVNR